MTIGAGVGGGRWGRAFLFRLRACRSSAPPTVGSPTPLTEEYEPAAVESKWQARWREEGTNHTELDRGDNPFYALMMFPYPSAEGLHVGNLFAFTGNDIFARFQRMQGLTVFEPLGFDAFGIHSENYALKVGVHPTELIPRNIANFRRQLERAGLMVDWRYAVDTTDPGYYRWTQWVFLKLFERGLAYRKKAAVNWCPFDKTVLANEQVINGECERCGTKVEQRVARAVVLCDLSLRTAPAGPISTGSTGRRPPRRRNATGSAGPTAPRFCLPPAATSRELPGRRTLSIRVFTTRPDTVFGATYLVLAPEHPLVDPLTTPMRSGRPSTRIASRRRNRIW